MSQVEILKKPGFIILLEGVSFDNLFDEFVFTTQGIGRGDLERFDRYFWELDLIKHKIWSFMISSPTKQGLYEGRQKVFRWEQGKGELMSCPSARVQGMNSWGKEGIALSRSQDLRATLTNGYPHAENCVAITSSTQTEIPIELIWEFCQSETFKENIRKLNTKVIIPTGVVGNVNFKVSDWEIKSQEKYPNGLPKPYSDDPTQWIFHGHPAHSDKPLQVAVARLLGYRFPAELDAEMELSDEARALVEQSKELLPFADEDGIVCLPPVRGESSAADRLLNLLAAAYGDDWSNDKLSQLLTNADHAGKTLETWLREKFFTQHCKVFQHRPFVWHIWDGLRDGFAALVNYHKLDYKNLETLIYTYLGDWITRQKQDIANGVDGAQEKLAAAEQLKKRLELILQGESPYDIFVRWKPLDKQPIGWNPDLNDGVRMNIRPFLSVPDVGKKDAGVLRDKPNIKWDKDRGKDVESAQWFHRFVGDRINDHHLSLEEKIAAKEEYGE